MRPEWPDGLEDELTEFVLQRVDQGVRERQAVLQFVLEGHTDKSFPAVYKRWRTKLREPFIVDGALQPVGSRSMVDVIRELRNQIVELEAELERCRERLTEYSTS